ncbi:TPA: hypothetical protein DDY56_03375 [Candidatus Uhrbacteria bacterium]|nr:MAG: hypothetical protein A2317_02870 [Candidatus Uhrbacteria bacterium RIFOXYB2_FULL_41_10]HAL50590.1 hypothetical protein [Candidatus Uhrbacteria bacterium]HAN06793.1 hypothetical protein [Candidatus Uhrbacteria bacterium]HAP66088.1 hypothetical protein [Candidatus Uhrbacteria bacterium]HBA51460.1 hypothetical protein [Candidatus Uhrbacteria bacterium]
MTPAVQQKELTMSMDMLGDIVRKLVALPESELGTVFDLLSKLNDQEWVQAFKRFLRKENPWPIIAGEEKWHEENGVIRFSVITNGTTGEGLIARLGSKSLRVSRYAKQVLCSPDFVPSESGTVVDVVVLKGSLFEDSVRTSANIRAEADKRRHKKLNIEVACLIREKFTDKELEAMGLWAIVAMHDPIDDSDGDPSLLGASRIDVGRWLNAYSAEPDDRWHHAYGFAFSK